MKLVMKFGGTSLAGPERIRNGARLVREHAAGNRVVVVVSAMDGVTEELLALAEVAGRSGHALTRTRLTEIRFRHEEAAGYLLSLQASEQS